MKENTEIKKLDQFLHCYKETLLRANKTHHTYLFTVSFSKINHISGIYIIDEFENKFISSKFLDRVSEFPITHFDINELIAESSNNFKFFDIFSPKNDKQIEFKKINKNSKSPLIKLINSNFRNGTTRKFITDSNGQKISIALDFENFSCDHFKLNYKI